jgi:hypothetical protein
MKCPNKSQHAERDLAGALGMPWRLTKEVGGNYLMSLSRRHAVEQSVHSAGTSPIYKTAE